jgi:hypothetical protein
MRKLGEGGLMGVSWSDKAEADLENINPIVKDQLRRNAEVTLPDIRPCTGKVHVGNGEIMWHRGITHEQEREAEWLWWEDDDGVQAWDYFFSTGSGPPQNSRSLASEALGRWPASGCRGLGSCQSRLTT